MLTPAALARESPGDAAFERRSIRMFGRHLCQDAFRSLLGIGSARFRRLWHCAQHGCKPPTDGRSLKKSHSHSSGPKSANRQAIIGFLQELYITLSEPLPEAKGPVRGDRKLAFQRRRGRRPRMAAKLHRKQDTPDMRLLPPGTFTDYLQMLRTRDGCEKNSLKLFTSATWQTVCVSQTLFLQPPSFFGMANSICPSLPIFESIQFNANLPRFGLSPLARSWP